MSFAVLGVDIDFKEVIQKIEAPVYPAGVVLSVVSERYTFLVGSHESGIDPGCVSASGKIHYMTVRESAFIQKGSVPVIVRTEVTAEPETQEFILVKELWPVRHLFCCKLCRIGQAHRAFVRLLGGDEDDTRGCSGSVDGSGRCILQHIDGEHILEVDGPDVCPWHTVHHYQRGCSGIDGCHTSQLHG